MKQEPLKCPFCKSILVKGGQEKYETLAEHVCDPNVEDYPLRDTYVCVCDDSKDAFWDDWGDYYCSTYIHHEKSTSAINSGACECDIMFEKERKLRSNILGNMYWTIKGKIGYWRYLFICKVKGYKY